MKKSLQNLPAISVITPSLNQGRYIEKTIKSVLDQKYPNLEYIIMDGGSKDNTLSVLKKYQKQLFWYSGNDKGQSNAINKGLKKSKREILCFLNSDDYLLPGTLHKISGYFLKNKDAVWLTGKCRIVDENNNEVRKFITQYKNFFLKYLRFWNIFTVVQFISQPATFWRRSAVESVGYFDESLNYDMDYDYWLRIWQKYPLGYIDDYLSSYRVHKDSKAVVSPETQFKIENEIVRKYQKNIFFLFLHHLHTSVSLLIYRNYLIK